MVQLEKLAEQHGRHTDDKFRIYRCLQETCEGHLSDCESLIFYPLGEGHHAELEYQFRDLFALEHVVDPHLVRDVAHQVPNLAVQHLTPNEETGNGPCHFDKLDQYD